MTKRDGSAKRPTIYLLSRELIQLDISDWPTVRELSFTCSQWGRDKIESTEQTQAMRV